MKLISTFILQEPKTTAPIVNEANLSLSSPTKYEVTNQPPHLRQYISYQGNKLQLRIPEFKLDALKRKEYGGLFSVLIPTEPWLRTQLDVIEKFVQENVNFTKNLIGAQTSAIVYKPLWKGDSMYVSLSTWCNVMQENPATDTVTSVPLENLGQGTYSITIEVPYIYIGPHKRGEDCSLLLRVVQIVYKPDTVEPTIIPSNPPEKKGRRPRNSNNALQPVQEVKSKTAQ